MLTLATAQKKRLTVLLAWLCLTSAIPAATQQASAPAATQDQINQQLLQRVQELEKEVQQLKGQPVTAPAPPVSPAPAPVAPPVAEAPSVNEVAPRLKFNVFGDVGWQIYNGSDSTFFFGSFDMFMTARLSDKVSALGEVLFLPNIADNTISVDVTRLLLKYRPNDYLTASVGRYNTWVGYYNTAFNKGEFLETTTDRPLIFAFDDFGGVLPMQDVGINLTGKIPSGKLGLNYVVEAGNGKAWGLSTEPTQNRQDANTSKSINGGLFVRPEKFSGLQLGFSIRHDNLSIPGPAVHETIFTAHAVFINNNYEILNEAALDRHTEPDVPGRPAFNTSGFYSQFSRRFGPYRPYFRYQYFNANGNDPVFAFAPQNDLAPSNFTGFVGRVNGPSAGIRWDFTEHSAFKLQYDRFDLRGLPGENGLTSQIAFTF
jgi:hypothetical protein